MSIRETDVIVVDDDPAVREALARLIASAGHSVQTFASAGEFLDGMRELRPGCLLLDVRLPDLDGLALQRQLYESGVVVPVIFMTGFADIRTSVRAIKAGAFDYLTKPVEARVLLGTIAEALKEEARTRSERVEAEELLRRYESLTRRETEVMHLVLAGLLNKQIAKELGISEKTVKVHRSRVMTKMGARRVANLIHFAMRLGKIEEGHPPARTGSRRESVTPGPGSAGQAAYAAASHATGEPESRPAPNDPDAIRRHPPSERIPDHFHASDSGEDPPPSG